MPAHGCRCAADCFYSLLIDGAVLADNSVFPCRNGNGYVLGGGVQYDDDITPVVSSGIVLQAEGNDTLGGIEEFQMLTYKVGITQTEGGMVLAQGYQVAVILEDLGVAFLVLPVEVVDAVG